MTLILKQHQVPLNEKGLSIQEALTKAGGFGKF